MPVRGSINVSLRWYLGGALVMLMVQAETSSPAGTLATSSATIVDSRLPVARRPNTATAEEFAGMPAARPASFTPGREAELPPLPTGIVDLPLSHLFVNPVGPKGLEFSPEALALDGKLVRFVGFMVQQGRPTPWRFYLTPVPVILHDQEYGYCDDLPAACVSVSVPRYLPPVLPHRSGRISVTGRLSLGNQEQPDGRISTVRLTVPPPAEGESLGIFFVKPFRAEAHTSPGEPPAQPTGTRQAAAPQTAANTP